jgi:hypothetical protein
MAALVASHMVRGGEGGGGANEPASTTPLCPRGSCYAHTPNRLVRTGLWSSCHHVAFVVYIDRSVSPSLKPISHAVVRQATVGGDGIRSPQPNDVM